MHSQTRSIIAALVLTTGSTLGADMYTVTDLGTLGDAVGASGISDSGISVGYALDPMYRYHGFINDDGDFQQITSMMSMNAQAQMMGINDLDMPILASYMLGMLQTNASIPMMGAMMVIGEMMPCAINDTMTVVGSRYVTAPSGLREELACRWDMGTITNLPSLNGATSSIAKGINDAGWVVGSSITSGSITPTATLWMNNAAFDLGSLGGDMSQAIAINENNTAVGISETPSGDTHAFRAAINTNGQVTERVDLGSLPGGYSIAISINDLDQIVGSSSNRAVLWENDTLIDLNTRIAPSSGWILNKATGINESGRIVGVGSLGGDPFRAFLLTPADCNADLNNDGTLDFFDISELLSGQIDFNADTVFDFFDISAFLQAFQAGCP